MPRPFRVHSLGHRFESGARFGGPRLTRTGTLVDPRPNSAAASHTDDLASTRRVTCFLATALVAG
jgi:hypothetical protein